MLKQVPNQEIEKLMKLTIPHNLKVESITIKYPCLVILTYSCIYIFG